MAESKHLDRLRRVAAELTEASLDLGEAIMLHREDIESFWDMLQQSSAKGRSKMTLVDGRDALATVAIQCDALEVVFEFVAGELKDVGVRSALKR